MGANLPIGVQLQLAPALNSDAGFPGKGGVPAQGPAGFDGVAGLLDAVELQVGVEEPAFDEMDHLLVAFDASKLSEGVFEENVPGIKAVGLVGREALVIFLDGLQDVHVDSGEWGL